MSCLLHLFLSAYLTSESVGIRSVSVGSSRNGLYDKSCVKILSNSLLAPSRIASRMQLTFQTYLWIIYFFDVRSNHVSILFHVCVTLFVCVYLPIGFVVTICSDTYLPMCGFTFLRLHVGVLNNVILAWSFFVFVWKTWQRSYYEYFKRKIMISMLVWSALIGWEKLNSQWEC